MNIKYALVTVLPHSEVDPFSRIPHPHGRRSPDVSPVAIAALRTLGRKAAVAHLAAMNSAQSYVPGS